MGQIDPVSQYSTENPFLTEILRYDKTGRPATTLQAQIRQQGVIRSETQPEAELVIDEDRLAQQRQYLDQVSGWILDRAYRYFRMGLYTEAQGQFQQYFRYQLFYGSSVLGTTNQYYNALFTLSWVNQTQNAKQASIELYNESLLRVLEPYTHDVREGADAREDPVLRPFIEQLQINGQLPTPARLNELPPVEAQLKLAAKLASEGETQASNQVLNFVRVFEAARIYPPGGVETRVRSEPLFRGFVPRVSDDLIRELYGMRGLPYIPGKHSLESDDDHLHKAKIDITDMDLAQYFTNRVDPITKDPNEDEERRKREEKLEEEIEEHTPDEEERREQEITRRVKRHKTHDEWELDVSAFD